jgi:molybdenum cofactor guanylyltransferase
VSLSAAIMAGGKSRRMGRDKAWIDLGDGRPIVQHVVDVAREVAQDVLIVANEQRYATLGVRVVPDAYPDTGVLGGIASGVAAAAHERVLVVACDMPFLLPRVLRYLAEQAEGYDAVVPQVAGEYETLHALYTKACLPAMRRALEAGERRVISFFPHVRVRAVAAEELRPLDLDLRSFTNVNTPDELAALRGRA